MRRNNKRILIVNTEAAYAEYLKVNIEKTFPTLEIAVVESGESALALVNKRGYALVITDSMLSGMGGVNLFYELKKHFPSLKTILLSDSFNTRQIKVLEREGLFGYIEKPFLMESLAEFIERALRS